VRRAWQSRLNLLTSAEVVAARADVRSAAARALELDPRSGYAYVALAYLEPWGHYLAHETLLRRAVDAAPANMQTLTAMSQFLNTVGRNEEALSFASQAIVLDPLHQYAASHHAAMLAFTGRYDECQASYDVLRANWPLNPEFLSPPLHFAAARGDWARFDRLSNIAADLGHTEGLQEALRVGRMLREPTPRRMEGLLRYIDAQLQETGTLEFGPLVVAYKLGLHDETFDFVKRASFESLFAETGPPPAGQFLPGVIFDPISNHDMMQDPRFVRFCARIGLCRYWIDTDHWPDFTANAPYDLKLEARRECDS
jgi:tetratricopeptide (TPR) repeat protein